MALTLPTTSLDHPARRLEPFDRRRALRLSIDPETACHLIAGVGETLWPARVLDLSTRGIRLALRRHFRPGDSAIVELANGVRIFSCALVLRIVHVAKQDDDSFVLGGEFARKLSQHELMALLS